MIGAFHWSPWAERRTKWPKLDYFFRILMRADGLVDMIKTLLAVATAPISEGFRQ